MVFSCQDIKNGNQIIIRTTGLKYIDHMVGNVGWNEMNTWVKFYEEVMGFVNFLSFDDKQITTEYSAEVK
jgi:4-hydroxyphenylpyruvate dioxygenase